MAIPKLFRQLNFGFGRVIESPDRLIQVTQADDDPAVRLRASCFMRSNFGKPDQFNLQCLQIQLLLSFIQLLYKNLDWQVLTASQNGRVW